MSSDVCKHCTHAACLDVCPTGRDLPHRVRHRRRAGGRLQRLRLLRPRVPVRRDRPARAAAPDAGARGRPLEVHALLRPPREDGSTPACAKACPTESIQFGPLDELRRRAADRLDEVVEDGFDGARLYGEDPGDGVGGFGAFFLLLDEPEVYGLPPDPVDRPATCRRCGGARPRPGPRSLAGLGVAFAGRAATEPGTRAPAPTTASRSSRRRSGSPRSAGTSSPAVWPAPRRCSRSLAARGNDRLARNASLIAAAAVASPPLLITDLGRPARFLNMLRVFKVTSPMSVGTWILSRRARRRRRGAARPRRRRAARAPRGWAVAGVLGPALDIHGRPALRHRGPGLARGPPGAAVPLRRRAAASAGAAAVFMTPPARRPRPADDARRSRRRRGVAEGPHVAPPGPARSEPYHSGKAGRYHQAARLLNGAGAALALVGRRRPLLRLSGALSLAGAVCTTLCDLRGGLRVGCRPALRARDAAGCAPDAVTIRAFLPRASGNTRP